MTTQALAQRVAAEANRIRFWPALLLAVLWLLRGVGWIAYHAVTVGWTALVWCVAAVKVGWQDAAQAAAARREATGGDSRVRGR